MDERAFLLEVQRESPPADRFEFIGYLQLEGQSEWIHAQPPASSLRALLAANDAARGVSYSVPPSSQDDVGRGLLLSADGRLFRERPEWIARRVAALKSAPESARSRLGPVSPIEGPADPLDILAAGRTVEGGIWDGDDRELVTSSGFPWRAVGVAVLRRNDVDINDADGWGGGGSAAMIGPRAVLTAAHVIVEDGRDAQPRVLAAAPAMRGDSWSNEDPPANGIDASQRFPFGLRRVTWYFWPEDHRENEFRYDYGVLILRNLSWSPGNIGFGYAGTSTLDYRAYNIAGYPQDSLNCTDSPDADGDCGGYMYRNFGNITAVGTYTGVHYLDTQRGMSGGPIYDYDDDDEDRTIYFINVAECDVSDCGLAKRLRSGSFGTICDWVGTFPSTHFANVEC